jgi:Icc protein
VTHNHPVRLLHLADPHLFEDESRELYGVVTAATFRATLAKGLAASPGPLDAILITGDIAEDGLRETYERFRSQMAKLGVPVICGPGNHESPAIMASVIDAPPLQYCGTVSLRGWRIVMLNSHVSGEDWGWLDAAELDRLERELESSADEHVLVCLHHQAAAVGSPWLDSVGLRNADALQFIMRRHRNLRGVLSGHVHQAFECARHGVRFLSTPSTCAQFAPNTRNCVMDLRPPGFRWLRLQPAGEIETEVVWLDELRRTARPPDSRREAVV